MGCQWDWASRWCCCCPEIPLISRKGAVRRFKGTRHPHPTPTPPPPAAAQVVRGDELATGRNLPREEKTKTPANAPSQPVGGSLKPHQNTTDNKRRCRWAQGQMDHKAKQDSSSDLQSQYDAVRLNLIGNCSADGRRGSTAILNNDYVYLQR